MAVTQYIFLWPKTNFFKINKLLSFFPSSTTLHILSSITKYQREEKHIKMHQVWEKPRVQWTLTHAYYLQKKLKKFINIVYGYGNPNRSSLVKMLKKLLGEIPVQNFYFFHCEFFFSVTLLDLDCASMTHRATEMTNKSLEEQG